MMFKRVVSVGMLVVFLFQTTGCYSWRNLPPQDLPSETADASKQLFLTLANGDQVVLEDAVLLEEEGLVRGLAIRFNGYTQPNPRPMDVPVADITEIRVHEFNTGKTVLAVVGIPTLTLLALAIIIAATKDSCPFIYAEGGSGFELKGELYSGAVFAEVERTDVLKLGDLETKEGRVRLKLANEAQETQYTDELTLLAVDHPRGTSVAPSPDGTLHAITRPQEPLSATGSREGDVVREVRGQDEEYWLPEPFSRDLRKPEDLRDRLELAFPRPDGARQAKLLVRIRNTYWADQAFGAFLGLLGNQMDAWYASQGQAMTPGGWGADFMAQHGLSLVVERRASSGWEEVGYFFPTGPMGWQEEVLAIPLTEAHPSETLNLRLTGGGVFWMVDRVAIDFTPSVPVVVHEIEPESAVDRQGRDVTGLLAESDNVYHIMPELGHWADITYRVPPLDPGMERTYLVRSEGYYIIHPKKSSQPDFAKLAAIQASPEGFLRFSMERLWELSGYTPPDVSRAPN